MSPKKTSAIIRIRDTMERYGVTLADLEMFDIGVRKAVRPEVEEAFCLSAPSESPRPVASSSWDYDEDDDDDEDFEDEDDNPTGRLFA